MGPTLKTAANGATISAAGHQFPILLSGLFFGVLQQRKTGSGTEFLMFEPCEMERVDATKTTAISFLSF